MAGLDVSDAFDASFFEEFTLIRGTETVNNHGRAQVEYEVTVGQLGVITSASPNDLQRLPEADLSQKSITITTQVRLQLASPGPTPDQTFKPDVIYWANNTYLVIHVEDYSRYGEGYLWAIAQTTDFTPSAPTPNPVNQIQAVPVEE